MTSGVVIGIGNAYRGDDGGRPRGRRAPRATRARRCRRARVRAEPTGSSTPGRARRRVRRRRRRLRRPRRARSTASTRATSRCPRACFRSSTHAFGVGDAVELARALGRLPRRRRRLRGRRRALRRRRRAEPRRRGGRRAPSSSRLEEEARARTGADAGSAGARGRGRRRRGRLSRDARASCALGPLSHFTPAHFREHFADAARGTIAEGAEVDAASRDRLRRCRASCSSPSSWRCR